jgi:urease accessory protein
MIKLVERTDQGQPQGILTLPLHLRIKSRLRAQLDDGREVGLFLERGRSLKDGDLLASEAGQVIQVRAAEESLSRATSDDPLLLARACYHLGNRHMPVQIGSGEICYLHDHVLDDMLRGLGLTVELRQAPFEPEPGAYGGSAAHAHAHSHSHSHSHSH